MNRWNIPNLIEKAVLQRDKSCVYCGIPFSDEPQNFREGRSWEHIVNDAKLVAPGNIVLCCRGCNSSKGSRLLEVWLESPYCKRKNISRDTVAEVVRAALLNPTARLKRLRKKSGFESRFTKNIPRGLKPSVYFQPLAAQLKPCPFKTSAIW